MSRPWWLCLLPLTIQLALVVSSDPDDDEDDALIYVDPDDNDVENVLREFEDIDISNADVRQCVWFAMQEYNKESQDKYVFLVSRILSASLQITNLKEYTINVEIARSNCKKSASNDKVCVIQENSKLQKKEDCTFIVGALPWKGEFVVLEKECEAI